MLTQSTLPFLFVAQCAFIMLAATHAARSGHATARPVTAGLALCLALAGFAAGSGWLALSGWYDSSAFLALFPGLWVPAVLAVFVGLLLIVSGTFRNGISDIIRQTPSHWFVAIQALRITAVGTLIKTLQGAFPHHVELAIGVNDLLYGLSALAIYPLAAGKRISRDALMMWHTVGIMILIVPGPLAIQFGLPGALQIFADPPTTTVMFDFPMVLAPTLIVPLFMLFNLAGILSAWGRPKTTGAQAHA